MFEIGSAKVLNANDKLPPPIVCCKLVDDVPPGLIEVVRGSDRSLRLHRKKCSAFFVLWKAELNHVFLGGNP